MQDSWSEGDLDGSELEDEEKECWLLALPLGNFTSSLEYVWKPFVLAQPC